MLKIHMSKILLLLFVLTVAITLCSCTNKISDNSNPKHTDDSIIDIDTESIKPLGSAVTSYENWKIFNYEYNGESKTDEEDNFDDELNLKYALFDCSESTPKYVIDIDPLRCFFIEQYAYNIVFVKLDYKSFYGIYKCDLKSDTSMTYELISAVENHAGTDLDDYTIEKVLYWDDEYVYVDAKESNVNSRIHVFFSIEIETGKCRKIDERAIPYDLPEPDFEFVEEFISNSVTAVDNLIGTRYISGTITHNGFVNSINIPLQCYEGRVDYNDFWDERSLSVDILPSGTFIRYIDIESNPKSYDKWKVDILDPLKNLRLYTVSDALLYVKTLNNQVHNVVDYIEGFTERSTFWFKNYPNGMGTEYHDYDQSLIQSLSLTDSSVNKTDYFDIWSIGAEEYFTVLPEYMSYNINDNDIFGINPDYEFYVSAYPLQIKIEK